MNPTNPYQQEIERLQQKNQELQYQLDNYDHYTGNEVAKLTKENTELKECIINAINLLKSVRESRSK
jgi:cell division septum initiation protein DivIVA